MNKRRLFLSSILAGGLAISAVTFAGPGGKLCGKGGNFDSAKSAEFMQKRLDRMGEKLSLTDDQKAKLKAVFESRATNAQAQREKMQAVRTGMQALDPSATDYEQKLKELAAQKAALMEQRMVNRGMQKQQISTILTEEQRTKMKEMRGKRGGKGWHKRGGHRGHKGGHRGGHY